MPTSGLRRCRRRAFDELERQLVLRGHEVVATLERVEQVTRPEVAAVEQRLANGGEPGVRRELDVVEADDRQILGHTDTTDPRRLEDARSLDVGCSEDRGGRPPEI